MLADAKTLKILKAGKPGGSWAFGKAKAKKRGLLKYTTRVPLWAMNEALEDERLNAIADERSGGPFVQVSLNDL